MLITIEMDEVTAGYVPAADGKYLIRTISTGPSKGVNYMNARVKRTFNEKKQCLEMSVDVNNQKITHISRNIVE